MGSFFMGDKATLFVSDSRFIALPPGKDAERFDINIPTEGGVQELHMAEFFECCENEGCQYNQLYR
jgi:hypothetical protein